MSMMRGIRGATTVRQNEVAEIHQATLELLETILQENDVKSEEIASCFVTVTHDLNATFPARALRDKEGWDLVPLMCALEIPVPGSLPQCIRLLLHVNTAKSQEEIRHVYLGASAALRPDLSLHQAERA
jgi:chorismate mutase